MSNAKHAPGPWQTRIDNTAEFPHQMDGPCFIVESNVADRHVAFVFGDEPANAVLIAAAPDLLAACKVVMAEAKYLPNTLSQITPIVSAAIAKAERAE